jgi:hypothetical protein
VTISKGSGWGRALGRPHDGPVVGTDAELREFVQRHRESGTKPIPTVGLAGGNLWTMMGGQSCVGRLHTDLAMVYAVDIGRIEIEGRTFWFLCHCVARSWDWRQSTVVLNTQYVGAYRFGVRAHPGDALLDVYCADLTFSDLPKVADRAKLGAHLPHPRISERRVSAWTETFSKRRPVWLDGERVGFTDRLDVSLEIDALTVVL